MRANKHFQYLHVLIHITIVVFSFHFIIFIFLFHCSCWSSINNSCGLLYVLWLAHFLGCMLFGNDSLLTSKYVHLEGHMSTDIVGHTIFL